MKFREFLLEDVRLTRLAHRLVKMGVDVPALVSEAATGTGPGLLGRIFNRFKRKQPVAADTDHPPLPPAGEQPDTVTSRKYEPPKDDMPAQSDMRSSIFHSVDPRDGKKKMWVQDNPKHPAGAHWKHNSNYTGGNVDDPRSYGAHVDDTWERTTKAKEAIASLRGLLQGDKYEGLLKSLEQAVQNHGDEPEEKPDHYQHMTPKEREWYDNLTGSQKRHFDSEMRSHGNDDPGDRAAVQSRAEKAKSQGYHDDDANWKWASGFVNRQKIRSRMGNNHADRLKDESHRPKSFKEWAARRDLMEMGPTVQPQQTSANAPPDPKTAMTNKKVVQAATSIAGRRKTPMGQMPADQIQSLSNEPEAKNLGPDFAKVIDMLTGKTQG